MAHVELGPSDDGVLFIGFDGGGADVGEAPPLDRLVVLAFGGIQRRREVVWEILNLKAGRR